MVAPKEQAQKAEPAADEQREAPAAPGRDRIQQCYAQAMQLMEEPTYDFDEAHGLLAECVAGDPGNPLYIDALLRNLRHKYGENPGGAQLVKRPATAEWKQALAQHDWDAVLRAGPSLLQHSPWDAETLQGLAQACAARNWPEAEVRYLRNALEAHPKGAALNRHLADRLARLGRFDEALACWQRVEEVDRYDPEPPRMIAHLNLEKSRQRVQDAEASPAAEPAPPEAEAAGRPAAAPAPAAEAPRKRRESGPRPLKRTRRQELEQTIVNMPGDEAAYLELADLHLAEHRSYDAQRTLLKALEISKDLQIIERLEDVNMLRAAERLRTAEQRAAAERTPAAAEMVDKLRQAKQQLEFEIFRRRCERYPQNKALQFQLGLRLKQLGNYRQALDRLQAGLEVLEHRALASLEIGEILQRYKLLPKALQCYRQAVRLAGSAPERHECRVRGLYRAATLAESMKLIDQAREYWAELLRIAPAYKDAQTRLDKLARISEDL